MAEDGKKIRVTLVKSLIGTRPEHRACVRGLGLRRRNHTVEVIDTPGNARHDQQGFVSSEAGGLRWC